MENPKSISIKVPVLARVEGEGALELTIADGELTDVKLRIYEPPRFFEKILEGRHYTEVPDIVARICGICPVAYQMSAIHAFESIFNTEVSNWTRAMRRVFYCGEWIESHSLHIHLLAAPDFLGFSSAPEMAKQFPQEVKRGLQLQHLGNQIIRAFGGRSVHPIGACVGGFHRAPEPKEIAVLIKQIESAIPLAEQLIAWVLKLPLHDSQQEFVSVALRNDTNYPMNFGSIISSSGLNIPIDQFEQHFIEHQQPHSTALHCLFDGKPYLVGPLARLNLNRDRLHPETLATLPNNLFRTPSNNMFHSIIARAIEIHYALVEAHALLQNYTKPKQAHVSVHPRAGIAYGCTEAPRGILWHRYQVDDNGYVINATITPPTSQNQARIEQDLRLGLREIGLDQDDAILRLHAEKIIRNYDPCISCATHFLDLRVNRL